MTVTPAPPAIPDTTSWPLSLRLDTLAAMVNLEIADHPIYDGIEVQRFDDERHGHGLLVFCSRRADRRVDFYLEPGLQVSPEAYTLGAGIGHWTTTEFDAARLHVGDDGVEVDVAFTDRDGRRIELRIDDRDGTPRRPAGLLAPVGASIERPASLLLVWMPRFDLVRRTASTPRLLIADVEVAPGRLPGAWLHRRHLIKVAAPVVTVEVNPRPGPPPGSSALDGDRQPAGSTGDRQPASATDGDRQRVIALDGDRQLVASTDGHEARLILDTALPTPAALAPGDTTSVRWHIEVDGRRLTGGTLTASRAGDRRSLAMMVDERWRPGRLPWLMTLVTTVMPVFRRWPTTYRWDAEVVADDPGASAGTWTRTGEMDGQAYRRATGSS